MPARHSDYTIVKISDITKFADILAKSLRAGLQWSRHLRKSVVVGTATERGGITRISVSVGAKGVNQSGDPLTGMAGAYEFGSGIHGSRSVGTYPIYPRNKKYLAFSFKKALPGTFPRRVRSPGKKIVGQLDDGRILFNYVDHPGVRARPYMQKAINATLQKATPELARAIRKNIVDEIRQTIKGIKK